MYARSWHEKINFSCIFSVFCHFVERIQCKMKLGGGMLKDKIQWGYVSVRVKGALGEGKIRTVDVCFT